LFHWAIQERGLGQPLAEILHESATPNNDKVAKIDRRK